MVTHVFIEEKIISINYGLHLSLDLPNDDEGDRINFRFLQVLDYHHMHKNLYWWIINALLIKLKYSIATNRGFSWLITRFFVSRIRQYIYRNALVIEIVHNLAFKGLNTPCNLALLKGSKLQLFRNICTISLLISINFIRCIITLLYVGVVVYNYA